MRLALLTAFATLVAVPAALGQQQPYVWPDPPGTQAAPPAAAPAPAPKATKATKATKKAPKKPVPQETDPRFEEEAGPPTADTAVPLPETATPPARRPKAAVRETLNILCDGPFAKTASHDGLVKAFGARNAVAQGGSTILFPNDPKKRLEVTWRDAAARRRVATIVIEAQSTWRARGFRLGDPLAQVEKVNGKAFRLSGFDGEYAGAARDWQGGKLDKLSGGCQLGMRFTSDPKAPAEARTKLANGDFVSDSPDVKAAKPVIVELVVGYPE